MSDTEVIVKDKLKNKLKEPKKFKVIFINDDFTPMDFVVAILMTIFKHSENEAMRLTMQIHNEGSAIVGIYGHEIAEQKGLETTTIARDHGHPLQVKIESE